MIYLAKVTRLKMDVLIPIETSSRELYYKIFLANLLTREGFRCFLGTKRSILTIAKSFRNFIYFDKGFHTGVSNSIYNTIKKQNGKIVNLDEEGGVDYQDNSVLRERYPVNLFQEVDKVFLWGCHQSTILRDRINTSNVIITGHPRFSLLKKDFAVLIKEEVENLRNVYGKFILINTNMSFGNNIKGEEFVYNNYNTRITNINRRIEFDKLKFEHFIELIRFLSKSVPKNIVIRPHPEENKDNYINRLKDLNNVHVVYKGSVVPWLLATDFMIHPDCTTAIESLMLGKKSISYLPPLYDSDLITPLPLQASHCFTNKKSISELLLEVREGFSEIDFADYPFLEEYFSFSKDSFSLIVNEIKKMFDYSPSTNALEFNTLIKLKLFYLRNIFGSSSSVRLSKNKLQGFNKKNVIEVNKKISLHLGTDVRVRVINGGLFSFE